MDIEKKKEQVAANSLRRGHVGLVEYASRLLFTAATTSAVFTEEERKVLFTYSMLVRDLEKTLSGGSTSHSKVKTLYDYIEQSSIAPFEEALPYMKYQETQQ